MLVQGGCPSKVVYYVFAPRALDCATRSRSRTQRGASATEANALSAQCQGTFLQKLDLSTGRLQLSLSKIRHVLTLIKLTNLLLHYRQKHDLFYLKISSFLGI